MAMITWDLRKLQQRLEGHKPHPIYVLAGDESFLVDEAIRLIKSKAVDEATMDFNVDTFVAPEDAASQVRDAVEMLPMMSQRRLILYRGVDNLKDKEWENLFPVLESPVDSSVLLLTCENLDKRKKPYKKLVEHAIWLDLRRPYENQIPSWIDYLAYRKDLKISKDASQLLKQFVGVNLTELNNELEKLKSYLGDRDEIGVEDVLSIVSRTRVDRIFDLTDAIGRCDRALAFQSLANLLEHGQNEIGALAMISRHVRILSMIKEGQKDGMTGPRLCAKAGIPQFLLNQYLTQVRLWSDDKITKTHRALLETDKALKSTALPAHVWLENFILKTC